MLALWRVFLVTDGIRTVTYSPDISCLAVTPARVP